MKYFKKITIFVIIAVSTFFLIFFYPMSRLSAYFNIDTNYRTMDVYNNNTVYSNLTKIVDSDIDKEYKNSAISIYGFSTQAMKDQANEFYKLFLYDSALLASILFIIGIVILGKYGRKKIYISASLLSSSTISFIFLIYIYNILYR